VWGTAESGESRSISSQQSVPATCLRQASLPLAPVYALHCARATVFSLPRLNRSLRDCRSFAVTSSMRHGPRKILSQVETHFRVRYHLRRNEGGMSAVRYSVKSRKSGFTFNQALRYGIISSVSPYLRIVGSLIDQASLIHPGRPQGVVV